MLKDNSFTCRSTNQTNTSRKDGKDFMMLYPLPTSLLMTCLRLLPAMALIKPPLMKVWAKPALCVELLITCWLNTGAKRPLLKKLLKKLQKANCYCPRIQPQAYMNLPAGIWSLLLKTCQPKMIREG